MKSNSKQEKDLKVRKCLVELKRIRSFVLANVDDVDYGSDWNQTMNIIANEISKSIVELENHG